MALSDKNIVITPNIGATDDPKIVFSGADASTAAQNITLYTYPTSNGTVSFEGSAGQLFSITNDLTGTIFSVNDISGIPSIEVDADGTIRLAEFGGNVLIGTSTDNGTDLLQVNGSVATAGNLLLDADNAEINLKSGITGTNGAVNWTFNTDSTNYVSLQIPYDTRATTGFHIDSGYPITIDASTQIRFALSGTTGMTYSATGLDIINGNLNAVDNIYLAGTLYHEGDTDTYLTFGTDTITLATGGSAEITVDTTGVRLGDTGNGYFQPVTGNYGSIQIDGGAHSGWEGYSIGGRAVFMHDNSNTMGLYDDVNNEWGFRYTFNGAAELYHNGVAKLATTATGASVTGTLTATAVTANLNTSTADGTNKVGYRNVPPVGTKTTSYTLAVGDVGKYVQIGAGGAITIPNSVFSEGDAITLFNNTSGNITVTCSITTAYIAGTDGDTSFVYIAPRGICTILFISGTVCVVTGNIS